MNKIKVYCGKTIIDKYGLELHPITQVLTAQRLIILAKQEKGDCVFEYYSNHPDFVSAMKYIGKKEGVNVEFYLDGKFLGNDIEPIFEDFNKAIDLINELGDTSDEK